MFKLGQLVQTAGVANSIPAEVVLACVRRHMRGEWGSLCDEDAAMNDYAVQAKSIGGELPYRLFSAYDFDDFKLWIITEYDESITTVLFPSEY